MEKTILELKEQIRRLEQRVRLPAPAPRRGTMVLSGFADESVAGATTYAPPPTSILAPDGEPQPGDDLADRTSSQRHRETVSGDNTGRAAPRQRAH